MTQKSGVSTRVPMVKDDTIRMDVVEEVLKAVNSLRLLKTCRLVSKSWNEVCCEVLRQTSAIVLNASPENEDCLKATRSIFIDRVGNFPSDWPNPFQNCKIHEASSFGNAEVFEFIQHQNLRVTTLEIVQAEGFDSESFEAFLVRCQGSIVHLKIQSKENFLMPLDAKLGKGWRSLKSMSLMDSCPAGSEPCSHMDFITALTGSQQIRSIRLEGHLPNITSLFSKNKDSWGELKQLSLTSEEPPKNVTADEICGFMRWAREIRFPSLTQLTMRFNSDNAKDKTWDKYAPYILPLILESSEVLKSLQVSFIPLAFVPACPGISHLTCAFANGDRIKDVTEERFPCLTSLHAVLYWKEEPFYADPKEFQPNGCVTKFTVSLRSDRGRRGMATLWPSLRDHFPNLGTLCLEPLVTVVTLNAIRKSLPRLGELQIKYISSHHLMGSPTFFRPSLASKGWALEDIEYVALLEMTELKRLILGEKVYVVRELLTDVLRKMPTLKFLSFFWNNSSLEVDVLPESLGHLQLVTVVCTEKQERQKLEMLAKTMKTLKLAQSLYI